MKEDVLKTVIDNLLSSAEEERRKDPEYQKLFKASEKGIRGLLNDAEFKMTGMALDCCQVIEEQFGCKITDEAYDLLIALPLLRDILEKKITKEEGSTYCVDKTHYIISEMMIKALKLKEKEHNND